MVWGHSKTNRRYANYHGLPGTRVSACCQYHDGEATIVYCLTFCYMMTCCGPATSACSKNLNPHCTKRHNALFHFLDVANSCMSGSASLHQTPFRTGTNSSNIAARSTPESSNTPTAPESSQRSIHSNQTHLTAESYWTRFQMPDPIR